MTHEVQQLLIKLEVLEKKLSEIEKYTSKKESVTSFILSNEEIEAKKLIEKEAGFEMPRTCGFQLLVKIYTRDEDLVTFKDSDGTERKIYIPKEVAQGDKYSSMVGLVVNRGPWSYIGENFKYSGPFCRIGDFIVFPRHEGPRINYRGMALIHVPDYMVYDVVEDPRYIEPDQRLEDLDKKYKPQLSQEELMQQHDEKIRHYQEMKQRAPGSKKFYTASTEKPSVIIPR